MSVSGTSHLVDLGPLGQPGSEDTCLARPEPVDLGGHRYFLVRDARGPRLLSSVCPHQGGTVALTETCFECPQHGWRFDLQSGECLSGPSAHLTEVPVAVRNGRLVAEIPDAALVAPASRPGRTVWPADFMIRLVGHACLEIRSAGFTLLTDPWLVGPAFLGAWVTYPNPAVDPATLRPDAIWISHEHSDHFHKPTLKAFRRETPIYVPDFPNGRLVRELRSMGFTRVQAMRFGEPYDVGPGLRITCFEPPGLWNDAIVLMDIGGVRLLNINDAGVNHRIASLIGPVDILTSAFNPASSYPFAWNHLSPEARAPIIDRARAGMLRMLQQAVKRYQPEYLVPFASHFTLWHPSHRTYVDAYRRNTLDDVLRVFQGSPVHVIDMLPGGWWEPATGTIDHGPDRTDLYDPERMRRWLDETFDQAVFDAHHPAKAALHQDEVEAYFHRLNDVPDIAFCEDLTVTVEGRDADPVAIPPIPPIEVSFEIRSGRLSTLHRRPVEPNLVIQVPLNVLRHLIRDQASWDEAHIGFWCHFSRTPDVYSAGFWRLLQAPYFLRPAPETDSSGAQPATHREPIAVDVSVAELIERFGGPAERVLGRYGLHCAGCPHAPAESLTLAAHRHGVGPASTERLIRELNVVLRREIRADRHAT
jgi:CMP-N-acetylneuraminate monooxygenase